ncbi:MAG: DUF1553 domain-containing protein [Planctomycetaceae bacterium]
MTRNPAYLPMLLAVLLAAAAPADSALQASPQQNTASQSSALYTQHIQPLLAAKCAACHGALRQAAGLRLDHGLGILKGGDSGPAVIPADASASLLLQRVRSDDPQIHMPPAGEGERLTAQQRDLLEQWISSGAAFPPAEAIPASPAEWWSVRPVTRPVVPPSADPWIRNPIDAFIAAAQQTQQLTPAVEASPPVLLRRLYLDLLGLPPTPAELRAWLADPAPDRFERKVDELLAHPAYGQRWGRHWMDVWRYSDWYGSRGINEIRYSQRHIWRWRDWIVDSLNADKPYDRMIQEMLAADEMAADDPAALAATGFLGRNWYKFDRNVWMFDTVEQTAQAFLAVTLRCARCHDHKFDPLSQREYYQFRAFFEPHDVRTDPLTGNLATEKDATLGDVLREGVSRVYDRELEVPTWVFQRGDNRFPDKDHPVSPAVPQFLGGNASVQTVSLPVNAWYPHLRPAVLTGLLNTADQNISTAEQTLEQARDKHTIARQAVLDRQQQLSETAAATDPAKPEPAAEPVLADNFRQQSAAWQVVSGDWVWQDGVLRQPAVTSFATIVAQPTLPRNCRILVRYRTLQPGSYRSVGFSFDYVDQGNSQDVYTATGDASQTIQAFHRSQGQQHYPAAGIVKTMLQVAQEVTVEAIVREQQLTLLLNGQQQLQYTLPLARRDGRLALWVHQGSAEFLQVEVRPLIASLADLQAAAAQADTAVKAAAANLDAVRAERESLTCRIAAEQARCGTATPADAQSLAVTAARAEKLAAAARTRTELASAADPAKITELQNTVDRLQQEAENGGQQYTPLGPAFPQTSTGRRLALANWITTPQHPRTARVAVNHIWLRHFGEALVPTVANFGMNGAQPSHPELLDWLASELQQNGWHMKQLHRLIVCSAAWRQASINPRTTEQDPGNRWLTRMNPRRMEAETVRDSLLHAAGLLDLQAGGPEIPEGDVQTVMRRSLYFRNTPNEKATLLETFDAPNPNECYRRQSSVVPQQALALMNSGLALDAARHLAQQLTTAAAQTDSPDTDQTFIHQAFETILSRSPTEQEITACRQFLSELPQQLQTADETFPAGPQTAQRQPSPDPAQRARENLLVVLFSHNDFVTIR